MAVEGAKTETYVIQERLFTKDASQMERYQDLFIGTRSLWTLFKYEITMLAASWVPGALGLFLRSRLYRLLLGKVGKGVVFGRNVVLRHPHKIHVGDNVAIDDNCVLDAKGTGNEGIKIGNGVFIGRNTILYCKDGDIVVGDDTMIGNNCQISSGNAVKIGKNVQIAAYSYLIGGTHSFDRTDIPVLRQERIGKGIVVEDNVWLGANVKVLDGVVLGRDAIVAAGAVVNETVPAFSVAGGVPARVIRTR